MKKLLAACGLGALLSLGVLPTAPLSKEQIEDTQQFVKSMALPAWFAMTPSNSAPTGVASGSQTSTHTNVATVNTVSWTTVDLGAATSTRVIAMYVTSRSNSSVNRTVTSATINGVSGYVVKQINNGSTPNNLALVVALVPTGTTNTTVTVNFSGNVIHCSIFVFRITGAAYLMPASIKTTTTDAEDMGVYVPANTAIIAAVIAQTTTSGTTWTNVTEVTDAVYTGTTLHSSANVDVATEATTRLINADVGGTVTDYCAMVASFQPLGGHAFISDAVVRYSNTSNNTTYSFAGSVIGPPADDRVVFVAVALGQANSRKITGVTLAGNPMTKIAQDTVTGDGAGHTAIYALLVPSSIALGTATIAVTSSGNQYDCAIWVIPAYGLDSVTPVDTDVDQLWSGSNSNMSTTIANADKGLAISVWAAWDGTDRAVMWSGLTERDEAHTEAQTNISVAWNSRLGVNSARTVTTTVSGSTSARCSMVAASFL